MSFTDEYFALERKRKKKAEEEAAKKSTGHSFSDQYFALEKARTAEKPVAEDIAPLYSRFSAPVKQTTTTTTKKATEQKAKKKEKEEEEERTWFRKGAFDDGYQFGDVTKTILGTTTDIAENLGAGIIGMGEKVVDAFASLAPYTVQSQLSQNPIYNPELQKKHDEIARQAKKEVGEFVKKDLYNEEEIAKAIVLGTDRSSVLGEKSDALVQSAGQLAATAALQGVGVPWFVTTGVTSFGSGVESALNDGASFEQAGMSAAISAGAEVLTEKLSGGISFGGKTLDDALTKTLARKLSNKVVRTMAKLGMDAVGEGSEEVISQVISNLGTSLYKEEKLSEILASEEAVDEYIESFIGGAVLGGGMSGVNAIQSGRQGVDYVSELTANEQKVVDKEYQDRIAEEEKNGKITDKRKSKIYDEVLRDMERGYISTDTIEEVLGGDTYKTYKDIVDSEDALTKEFEELGQKTNATLAEQSRYGELKQQLDDIKQNSQRSQYQSKLGEEVFGLVKGDRLIESYNERGRRSQVFEADLTQYNEKQQAVIQKAIDSGILNNTNRTHEFVDMVAKISADRGVPFDFTNNEKLKGSSFAVDGATVNGFVTKDGVTLNIDSAKSLNSVVGHEITHVLEGTELYTELQSVLKTYAESKGEYESRRTSLSELYKDIEGADIDAELTADLVGDYLFTDSDFINRLSTENRNVFQKIYDEIKYLCKVATAGSKEARELEKVKRAFEKAYKEGGKGVEGVKHSLTIKHTDGTVEELADARNLTNEQAVGYLNQAKSGKLKWDAYIPVRKDTPQVIIDTLAEVGEGVENLSMVMQVRKAQQSMSPENRGNRSGKHGNNVRKHALAPEEVVEIVNNLDNPTMVILQTNRKYDNGNPRPNNVVVFVEYSNNGNEGVAAIEFESSINPEYIGTEYGDTEYHTVVTVFEPDVERNGEPFDYAEELLSNPDNIELEIKRGQAAESAIGKKHPNTSSESPSFKESVPQNGNTVKGKLSLSKDSNGNNLSPAVQNRFGKSKVVDENGSLKVVYHGTATGEFSIFDKAKGSVEGDFGSGFYFTDNEADVSEHYEGGGPDFDNKVARRAEQIASEEEIDYSEAEERARNELYKGSHKFEVYLNIENPAIVGETILFDPDKYFSEYNEEDYDDYEDYEGDVEQLLTDDIDNIIWEIERNVDIYSTDGIAEILYEAVNEGGIGVEELKAKLNNLYLEDNNGNLVANEVARQIIESLGYDGIIDPTVSGKWNMDIEEGTTHYIVFKPNQIKAVTNQNPTDNPDIHRSLSRQGETPKRYGNFNVYGEDFRVQSAPVQEVPVAENSKEAFDSFMAQADQYAPPATKEDIAPVAQATPKPVAPVKEAYEAIRPKKEPQPRMAKATPAEQARAQVLTEEPKAEKKKPAAWNLFKDNFVDKGTIFETLSLKTGNRELQARWKAIGRAESRAQWFMENGSASSRSLKNIRATVEKSGKTQQFYEYLYHRHNVDRMNLEDRYEDVENKPVFGYDVTSEMSEAEAAKLEAANPEFKRWAHQVYAYMTSLREMMVDSGVISRETAKLWAEMYPHYVPVRRKGDEGLNINVALDTKRTGVNAPIKRATGGNRDILPLFDTMAMRTEQTFKAVAKNRFGVELKNLLGTAIENEAVDIDEAIDSVENEELLQEGKNGRNPTFTVFENGEKVTFEITDEMYDTMKPKSKGMAYTNKVLNTANNIRRGLITEYNPAFMLTNPIKDTQDVLINSQHPARTYANYPTAIAELLGKNGQWYREYMENGGEQNTYFDGESKTFVKEKSGLSKAVGFPLEKISQANNFIERIPRMAEYIASRKAGSSIDVAMLDAARVTTDFSAGGDLVKWANRNGFTFLNASVQGAVQQVRNVREAKAEGLKGWAKLAAKVTVAGLPAILLNHLLWDDDEEYEELSDYVKQNYYIVGKFGDGQFVRIPKGRTLAVIQNAFEQMENLVTGNDEVDMEAFGELVVSNLAPSNPLDNNLIAPITQALGNKTWYGEALVPTRLQDLPAAEQYDESTDSVSKWLGEKLNVSPYKINYVLDQYSGAIGDMFLPMITPEAEGGDNSLLGNMLAPVKDKFTTDSVMNNQNVSDFYDMKEELTVNANASDATDEDVLKSMYMNSVSSDMAKLYAEKREIQNSNLSDEEKYERVRNIQTQIDEGMEEALQTYDQISYEDDYREGGRYARVGGKLYEWYVPEKGSSAEEGWRKLSDEQVTKYEVTKAAGDASYATDGENHYRWYIPGEDADEDTKPGWRKISDDELEKQKEVTSGLGITPEEYWGAKDEYSYAYKYPENYAVAKAVGGYDAYKGYSSDLYDIKADKDASGKSISGSRKEKVADYINNLDADYYTKIILFKNEYNSDDTYNMEIIEYLNGREDISYEEMETILKKLGFDVDAEGNISW